MAARPRKHNINVPNLYSKLDKRTQKVYWQYRHPLTGQFIGFGTDADAAKLAATELNRLLAQQEADGSARAYRFRRLSECVPSPR